MRKFWIDTDTASDDAVALIMALRHPDIDVLGISCVSGNVPVEQATHNALYVAELCADDGALDVPVHQGVDRPLIRPYHHAKDFHGEDGLGDQGYAVESRQAHPQHAVPAMIDAIRAQAQAGERVTLVTLGPLTNVAIALRLAPDIIPHIERCVVMGGAAATVGNVTPAAEYNMWCDPESARIVFHAGMPVQMVGWEFCIGDYALSDEDIAHVRAFNNAYADFTIDCNATLIEAYHQQTGMYGISLPDAVAMAVALQPDIATTDEHFVDIACDNDLTRGMTVVDKLNETYNHYNVGTRWDWLRANVPKTIVTWHVDVARWKDLLYQLLQTEVKI
jgi:purine nucleosidase